MKPKSIKITYWIITGLFALFMLFAGITEAMQHESGRQIMQHLGYPAHVLLVLGAGKILAALALIQNKFKIIKEWAYAGLTFNFIGACVARAYGQDSLGLILSPLLFMAAMFASYYLWKKITHPPVKQLRLVPSPEPMAQIA
ncbi:DoxX family protein [Adhaeribacter pallidiroseus]|uniref:DoxX family protein n=1 Tax=Adhaeribacter pallidiroseus TaxID=2072847 RepID=A0A369QHM8_9BACT|nr:DoxX family protein [Adhaeribacter pallidiroseus]RDC63800.1 hypothetical protein AHMF7616_02409 [Adhaeribacter pallidiroseus]